jgi:thiamine-phosphate pyrophosphorylase
MSSSSSPRRRRLEILAGAAVYLVTEESLSAGRASEDIALAALEAGVRVIQVREKDGPARRALEIARNLRRATRRYGALLIVNDRVDIALACDADGVHLGQEDLPLSVAREMLGDDYLVGLSITGPDQLTAPDARAADYLGVGAVFPTGSKSDASLTGLALLERARQASRAPIVAIGGLDASNAGLAVRSGADVVAVISAITRAPDPGVAAAELLRVTREALASGRPAPVAGAAGVSAGASAIMPGRASGTEERS